MGNAPLTRIDPALDILAPHAHECGACGHRIFDFQEWATFRVKGLCEMRVHIACFVEKGPGTIAHEYRNRIGDQLPGSRPEFPVGVTH